MANPSTYKLEGGTLGAMEVDLEYTATGTSAAQTLTRGGEYVASATTSGTGVLTVVMKEQWVAFLNHVGKVQQATYAAGGACNVELTANNITNATTPSLVFLITQSTGAAVSAASGDIVRLTIKLTYTAY